MKALFVIDDNGQKLDDLRRFLEERGYAYRETTPESGDKPDFARIAMESADVQLLWVRDDLRISYANEAACRALGYGREELENMSLGDIAPSCSGEEFAERWRTVRSRGVDLFEATHRAKDGRIYPVEIRSHFVAWGEREYCCCFVTDREEQRRGEEKRLLHEFCIEKAAIGIFKTTTGGRILTANEYACRSLDYSIAELSHMTIFDIDPAITRERFADIREALVATGSITFETVHCRRDGITFPVEISANQLTYNGVSYTYCFVRDITDRRLTELALRDSEEKFRLLTETSPNAIILLRGERIVYANAAAIQIGGYRREDVSGKELGLFLHGDHLAIARERLLALGRGELRSGRYEYRIRTRAGNDRWVLSSSVVMKYGESDSVLVTFVDITDQKRAEEERSNLEAQLNQARKMEAIGRFAGGIAHDFNNILSAVMGFSELMAVKMEQDNPFRPHVTQVLAAGERAAQLTRGLLAFSRKQVLHMRLLDVHEVVDGIKRMLCRLIPEDIDFRVKTARGIIGVMADRGQLEQVLMNLVTNARDSMTSGGALDIEAVPDEIDERFIARHGFGTPGAYARISVSDTGCGMDQETREKIFEPFFTTKKAGKGTGLGLSIIYGIVKQHNGFIVVDSALGQGTTFRLYLPLAIGESEECPDERRQPLPAGGTETVLLVEDDQDVRDLNRVVLEEAGYTVIEAVDGREALEKIREGNGPIHILVSDIIMPNLDGKTLYDEVMKVRPDMKALFISGYAEDTLDARGLFKDEHNFLPKPVLPSELLQRVREILDRNAPPDGGLNRKGDAL